MKVIETKIPGILIIEPKIISDERGSFFESFELERYLDAGIKFKFFQDNISISKKNTIRGLHYQVGYFAQGKLCQVISGKVLDVAVDVRSGSPTFGKHIAVELSSENHRQLWIPPGFAHGFSVLSEEAIFMYKCTAKYSKQHERTILFNDTTLNIDWKVDKPILSEKDLKAKKFDEIESEFIFGKY